MCIQYFDIKKYHDSRPSNLMAYSYANDSKYLKIFNYGLGFDDVYSIIRIPAR